MKRNNIELMYCLNKRMIADYYTKPLQGSLFRKTRDIIMVHAPFADEEYVGVNGKASIKIGDKVNVNQEASEERSNDVSRRSVIRTTKNNSVKSTDKIRIYADIVRTGGKIKA